VNDFKFFSRKKIVLIVIAVLSAIVLISWLLTPSPLRLQLVRAAKGSLSVSVDNEGIVRVHDAYVVTSPIAATIERIVLRTGDTVTRGDVLAWLLPLSIDLQSREQTLARLQAAQARWSEATLQQREAEINHELARHELERQKALVRDHFISPQALDQLIARESTARAAVSTAQARTKAVQAALTEARAAVNTFTHAAERKIAVLSPASGRILSINQQSERTIAAGLPLMTVGDPSQMEAVVDVLSVDAVKIQPGMRLLLRDWGGDTPLEARVRLVEPVAFTKISALGIEEQRVNVIADPVGSPWPLGDGYRIQARIVLWQQDGVLKLPGSSVFRVGNDWRIFVAENGRAKERTVTISQRNRDDVQIISGLREGEQVIRFPSRQVSDGARILAE
jgi:HlyD family secretion protein